MKQKQKYFRDHLQIAEHLFEEFVLNKRQKDEW